MLVISNDEIIESMKSSLEEGVRLNDSELLDFVPSLSEREREAIKLRLQGLKFMEISKKLLNIKKGKVGISMERAIQIYKRGISKLSNPSLHWMVFSNEELNERISYIHKRFYHYRVDTEEPSTLGRSFIKPYLYQ